MEQLLFNLTPPQDPPPDGAVTVRPNLWLMTPEDIPPLLFTVEEVARFLSVGRHRIFDLIREGRLRSVKVGASRRISARAVADLVAELEISESV